MLTPLIQVKRKKKNRTIVSDDVMLHRIPNNIAIVDTRKYVPGQNTTSVTNSIVSSSNSIINAISIIYFE